MGVITKIEVKEVQKYLKNFNILELKETNNGITDTTYVCIDINNEKTILKLYERSTVKDVRNELLILSKLKNVPKALSDIILFKNKPMVLFSYLEGSVIEKTSETSIKEISIFLKELHLKKINIETTNIYSFLNMKKMYYLCIKDETIAKSKKDEITLMYEKIKDIKLFKNSLIHGDLFPDNCKFINKKLSGVFDFSHSCKGDYRFDISVVLNSWCFDKRVLNLGLVGIFLKEYNYNLESKIKIKELKVYMLYASFYYLLQRIVNKNDIKKDYMEYFDKFKIIDSLL